MDLSQRRIAITSNFDDETFSERMLDLPPMDADLAREICELANQINPHGHIYYKSVLPNYTPYTYDPSGQ